MSMVGSIPFAVATSAVAAGIGGNVFGALRTLEDTAQPQKALGMVSGGVIATAAIGTGVAMIALGENGTRFPIARSAGAKALGIGAVVLAGVAAAVAGARLAEQHFG